MIDPSLRLRRAILLNDTPLVKRVLKSNPSVLQNPDPLDSNNTSLHLAAKNGHEEICVGFKMCSKSANPAEGHG